MTKRARPGDELKCRQVQKVLQAYLDGELDESMVVGVSEHLNACARCGLDAATYRHLHTNLAQLRRSVEPDVLARLEDFVHAL